MRANLGRIGNMNVLGYLADGTAVVAAPAASPPGAGIQSNAQAMVQGIPQNSGGNTVQGRGLVFSYQTPSIASLAAGAASTQTIQFDNNSIFTWLRTTIIADIAGAVETSSSFVIPLVTLQITDTGNGMSFMNSPIPLGAMAGSGQLPFILPTPQFVQPNASWQFQFSNYSAATTYNNLRLQLWGFRTFNTGTANT